MIKLMELLLEKEPDKKSDSDSANTKGPKDPPKDEPKDDNAGDQDGDQASNQAGDQAGNEADDGLGDLGDFGPDDESGDSGNSESDAETETPESFDELTTKIPTIKNSIDSDAPELNFTDSNFYLTNFIGKTEYGSILVGLPDLTTNQSKQFFVDVIFKTILKASRDIVNSNRKVVLMLQDELPMVNNQFTNDSVGSIAKALSQKLGQNIIFDTWSDYSQSIIDELAKRTNRSQEEITSALYCVLLFKKDNGNLLNKFKTPSTLKLLKYYGVDTYDEQAVLKLAFPENNGDPQNAISYIIKAYDELLQVKMLKKIIRYEKNGDGVIVLSNPNIAFKLKPTLEKLYEKPEPTDVPDVDSDLNKDSKKKTPTDNKNEQ
jgi:hypothetical protein